MLWRERTNEMSDEMVEMGSCAYLEHVGDGLESSVGMVGEPGGLGDCNQRDSENSQLQARRNQKRLEF